MKKVLFLLLTLLSFNTMAQGAGIVKGFDGGMMLHTGFVKGEFPQLAHTVSGMPFGIGGGANTNLLIKGNPVSAWEPVENTYFNKQVFLAIDPFIGCPEVYPRQGRSGCYDANIRLF